MQGPPLRVIGLKHDNNLFN